MPRKTSAPRASSDSKAASSSHSKKINSFPSGGPDTNRTSRMPSMLPPNLDRSSAKLASSRTPSSKPFHQLPSLLPKLDSDSKFMPKSLKSTPNVASELGVIDRDPGTMPGPVDRRAAPALAPLDRKTGTKLAPVNQLWGQTIRPPSLQVPAMASRQLQYVSLPPALKLEQDSWAYERIRIAGVCPMGFAWLRIENGYICSAGIHVITDHQLANGTAGLYYT